MATGPGNTQFSITLPNEAIEMIDDLRGTKLWGANRGEIARNLILDALKRLAADEIVRMRGLPRR
jgi:hypothetical protein